MKAKRVYLHCLECGTRCRRTGRKEITGYAYYHGEQIPIYEWEYECPNCARMYLWDFYSNRLYRGSFDDIHRRTARTKRKNEKKIVDPPSRGLNHAYR